MWKRISELFSHLPAQRQVARKLIELGLSINSEGKILCGDVEIKEISLARASGVDRRIVVSTVSSILSDKSLSRLFSGIKPAGSLLKDVAKDLGFGVVELEAQAAKPAIIAKATGILAKRRISIRQIYAKDPELYEVPTLTIITERPIPGTLLAEFSKIPGVTKVSVF